MSQLEEAVLSLERHFAERGWDTPLSLYALVRSGELRRAEPEIADQLPADADALVPVEQEALPGEDAVEDALASIAWPPGVEGCAIVMERVVLPPEIEDEIPEDEAEAAEFAANHPEREDVRMVVGVLRGGDRHSALRLRRHDSDDEVLTGPDLVPALAQALAATLEPDEPEIPVEG